MIKFVIKILCLGLILLLGYYFFLGSPEDKERAKAVFSEAGDLFAELGNFIKGEKDKFDRGDYEAELEKIRDLLDKVKEKASDLSSLQDTSNGVQALMLDRKYKSLKELSEREDLTEEEMEELQEQIKLLHEQADELATNSEEGTTSLPKL
ncbi:hypothetical protein [Pelagicoccus albus]|uniref:Uncharacterized protein n=1 Tax=Pelagicoccus albus TaxID=415222 RepID=A0A7X1B4F7_9BACT|nr:hypothetical protein [Pelagicoccus albus]MBC2605461.1 hypothetical protein [Pelagicoccus albus]